LRALPIGSNANRRLFSSGSGANIFGAQRTTRSAFGYWMRGKHRHKFRKPSQNTCWLPGFDCLHRSRRDLQVRSSLESSADTTLIRETPWLVQALERLPTAFPSAVLIHGQAGLGKDRLAAQLAQSELCEGEHAVSEACGTCAACHLFIAGTHPDFRRLEPDSADTETGEGSAESTEKSEASPRSKRKKVQIPVAAIRELLDLVSRTPYRARAKIILISPAEAMHPSAAIALLKMLEEPPPRTHFLLVSHQPHRLPATIISRCFRMPVLMPTADVSRQWLDGHSHDKRAGLALAMSGYAPLAALKLLQDTEYWSARDNLMARLGDGADALELAVHAEQLEPSQVAELLAMWAFDMLAVQAGVPPRYHADHAAAVASMGKRVSGDAVALWHDRILEFARAAYHPLNRRLSLEALFAQYPGTAR
jgi:DNA polymerase-3 subunit delta'